MANEFEVIPPNQIAQAPEMTEFRDPRLSDARRCANCMLSDGKCPYAFREEDGTCYFSKLVQISAKNKAELLGMVVGLLEMQIDRIMNLYHIEKTTGNYANADLSREIEMFMGMVEKLKKISSDDSFLRIEAKGSNIIRDLFNINR